MAFNFRSKRSAALAVLTAASLGLAVACGGTTTTGGGTTTAESPAAGTSPAASDLTGNVLVDGSSTVFPISEAMAEEFMKANPGVRVTVVCLVRAWLQEVLRG
jgi:ABC-type phosphate transport system, periplasmic component